MNDYTLRNYAVFVKAPRIIARLFENNDSKILPEERVTYLLDGRHGPSYSLS